MGSNAPSPLIAATRPPAEACCQEALRRKLINDALLFLSACAQKAILVSMNSRDMDLLLRFRPETTLAGATLHTRDTLTPGESHAVSCHAA